MKWFRHDASMIYDPRIRLLGAELKAEGFGVYIGLITYIACHGEDFQVKVVDVQEGPKKKPEDLSTEHAKIRENLGGHPEDFQNVPGVSLRDLSGILFTTRKKLLKTIEVCVTLGLFDPSKWRASMVLWSPMLAADQEQYTKRKERYRNHVRTMSGQTSENVALQEQRQEQIHTQEQEQIQEQKDLVVLLKSALNVEKLSTSDSQDALVPPVSDDEIKQFRRLVVEDIRKRNRHGAEKFDWIPSEIEICRLLRGGDPEHKLRLCYQAMNLLGGDSSYPQVVRRAVGMMLDASRRKRITNPFGWLWTCLHGNAGGTTPWVQLATAGEER
jgi:hypothetical protein